MEVVNQSIYITAVGISSGVIISVAILCVQQILHTFKVSSK